MDFNSTNNFLKSTKLNPSKKLGQNFLIDEKFSKSLIDSVDFNGVDTILEIGPGLGAITQYLDKTSIRLILIELDKRLAENIKKQYKHLTVINDNCLDVDWEEAVKPAKKPIVVTNLPYSISTLALIKFLKQNDIKTMYCMLQKEVVERMNAKISTKQYNAFSILCQQLSSIETLFFVDRTLFLPAPDVDSLFIKITKNEKKYDEKFDKFIKLCFLQKRKTLINNLKPYFSIDKVREVLSKNNISSQVRAEELNLEKFIILCKELN